MVSSERRFESYSPDKESDSSEGNFIPINMVYVAERFRRKFVALVYAGSNPVGHPDRLSDSE